MDGIAATRGGTKRPRQRQSQRLRRRQQRLQQWRHCRNSGGNNSPGDGGRAAAAAVADSDTSSNGPRRSSNRRAATTVPTTAATAVGERTLTLCVFAIELSDLRLEMYCVVCRGPIRLNQDPIYPNLPGNLPQFTLYQVKPHPCIWLALTATTKPISLITLHFPTFAPGEYNISFPLLITHFSPQAKEAGGLPFIIAGMVFMLVDTSLYRFY